jgi:F0F1-type ATP synthase membrane subunit b/b'
VSEPRSIEADIEELKAWTREAHAAIKDVRAVLKEAAEVKEKVTETFAFYHNQTLDLVVEEVQNSINRKLEEFVKTLQVQVNSTRRTLVKKINDTAISVKQADEKSAEKVMTIGDAISTLQELSERLVGEEKSAEIFCQCLAEAVVRAKEITKANKLAAASRRTPLRRTRNRRTR